MTTYTLSVTPNSLEMQLIANTATFQSPLNASVQTLDRDGMKWAANLNYLNVEQANRAELMALIAELRGQSNRLRVTAYDNPARGTYGGTPLVAGGSQTGNSLNVDGVGSVTNWIRRGDYFSVDVNGEHELKIATADASSVAGAITLSFEPKLRASPLNNAAIYVQDGVLTKPQGVFMLAGAANGWGSSPGPNSPFSSITLQLIEDVFISQA